MCHAAAPRGLSPTGYSLLAWLQGEIEIEHGQGKLRAPKPFPPSSPSLPSSCLPSSISSESSCHRQGGRRRPTPSQSLCVAVPVLLAVVGVSRLRMNLLICRTAAAVYAVTHRCFPTRTTTDTQPRHRLVNPARVAAPCLAHQHQRQTATTPLHRLATPSRAMAPRLAHQRQSQTTPLHRLANLARASTTATPMAATAAILSTLVLALHLRLLDLAGRHRRAASLSAPSGPSASTIGNGDGVDLSARPARLSAQSTSGNTTSTPSGQAGSSTSGNNAAASTPPICSTSWSQLPARACGLKLPTAASTTGSAFSSSAQGAVDEGTQAPGGAAMARGCSPAPSSAQPTTTASDCSGSRSSRSIFDPAATGRSRSPTTHPSAQASATTVPVDYIKSAVTNGLRRMVDSSSGQGPGYGQGYGCGQGPGHGLAPGFGPANFATRPRAAAHSSLPASMTRGVRFHSRLPDCRRVSSGRIRVAEPRAADRARAKWSMRSSTCRSRTTA